MQQLLVLYAQKSWKFSYRKRQNIINVRRNGSILPIPSLDNSISLHTYYRHTDIYLRLEMIDIYRIDIYLGSVSQEFTVSNTFVPYNEFVKIVKKSYYLLSTQNLKSHLLKQTVVSIGVNGSVHHSM